MLELKNVVSLFDGMRKCFNVKTLSHKMDFDNWRLFKCISKY